MANYKNQLSLLVLLSQAISCGTYAHAKNSIEVPAELSKEPIAERPYADEAVKHYNKAHELHQQGHLNQAIVEYNRAVECDSRMQEVWCNMGGIYSAIGRDDDALEALPRSNTSLLPPNPAESYQPNFRMPEKRNELRNPRNVFQNR